MFQQRHYESIAEAFSLAYSSTDHEDVVLMTARFMAHALEADNPRFDRERFFRAVKGEES